jgi:hypothetical protein
VKRHFIIPDRQNKPGVPLEHNRWIGAAIRKYEPDVVIDLGDGADFESISTHAEPGGLSREGLRLKADFDAYNEGERLLREGMAGYKPKRMVRLRGNHEHRLTRYLEKNPVLDGLIGLHMLDDKGWEIVPYRDGHPGVIHIDGIAYAHYFAQPNTGKAISGTVATRIARIGGSFVQGHQQGLMRGDVQYATGRMAYGIVAGSAYLHDEGYKGAANTHWRGVVVLNEVRDGEFCEMPLSIDYLCREFAGTSVARWLQRNRRNAKDRFSLARKAA